jgi:acyl-CoA dehydrogenase
MIWYGAWVLDQGEPGLHESSRANVMVSQALWRVRDR